MRFYDDDAIDNQEADPLLNQPPVGTKRVLTRNDDTPKPNGDAENHNEIEVEQIVKKQKVAENGDHAIVPQTKTEVKKTTEVKKREKKEVVPTPEPEILSGPRQRKKRFMEEEDYSSEDELSSSENYDSKKTKKVTRSTASAKGYTTTETSATVQSSASKNGKPSNQNQVSKILNQQVISKLDDSVKNNKNLMKMISKITRN